MRNSKYYDRLENLNKLGIEIPPKLKNVFDYFNETIAVNKLNLKVYKKSLKLLLKGDVVYRLKIEDNHVYLPVLFEFYGTKDIRERLDLADQEVYFLIGYLFHKRKEDLLKNNNLQSYGTRTRYKIY